MKKRVTVNIVIQNEFVMGDESAVFFSGEPVDSVDPAFDMWDIFIKYGVMKSRGECKRNKKIRDIPDGYSETKIGKLRNMFYIIKPTICNVLPWVEEE